MTENQNHQTNIESEITTYTHIYILSWCVTSISANMPLSHIILTLSPPIIALSEYCQPPG